jgi:HEAT repeat protein
MHRVLVAFAVLSLIPVAAAQGATAPAADLAKAIAEMRNLPAKLVGREAEQRGPRIQAAWETLIAAQDDGVNALLAEAARLDAAKQKDDLFRLGAAAVVWQIGHLERVKDVLALWANADFAAKYAYAFPVAFEAARDGDERALPLLVALLRDHRGTFCVVDHVMDLSWPLTHEFLWGPMGRNAVPALQAVLENEKDPTVVSSAITLLADAWDTESLPRIRTIARDASNGARHSAIAALGKFGHPDDFEYLCEELTDTDAKVVRACVRALCAFGDLRAVPRLVRLTKHANEELRLHALGALGVLPTVDGLAVLADRLPALDQAQRGCLADGPPLLHDVHVTWGAYQRLDGEERGKLLADACAKADEKFRLKDDDRKLTRAEFESACAACIAASRIPAEHRWIEVRHVLGVATPADVPLLLDVRGSLFRLLSDECLEEVATLDGILQRLVRSQYRKEPGLCEQVEPPAAKGEAK